MNTQQSTMIARIGLHNNLCIDEQLDPLDTIVLASDIKTLWGDGMLLSSLWKLGYIQKSDGFSDYLLQLTQYGINEYIKSKGGNLE